MAVRIYALAKDLNIDGKELVDICARAGVTGKGSALASLSDEEVDKLKQFMNGGGNAPKATATQQAPPPPTRPAEPARGGRMRVIVAPKSRPLTPEPPAASEPEPAPPQKTEPTADEPKKPAAAAAAEAPAELPQPESKPTPDEAGQGPLAGMLRREDYIGPGGAGGRPPMLSGSRGGGLRDASKPKRAGESPKPRPVVKLAAMPAPAQPAAPKKKKEDEAPAQKPDMKLPAEVMGGGRLGAKPLAAHLKRAERTLEAEKIRAKSGVGVRKDVEDDDTARGKGRGRGRGAASPAEDKSRPMLGGREQRQLSRTRSRGPRNNYDGGRRRSFRRGRSGVNTAAPRKDAVTVELPCTVRDLSEAIGVPAAQILRVLMTEGVMTTITAMIEPDLAEFVAAELGAEVNFQLAETLEDKLLSEIDDSEDDEASLVPRAPVITFLGHVDHGKTSLLDRIIGIDVAKGESGGITQHIRAYQIDNGGKPIAFVDTPGHAAFTEMRARGANVTDIAVIVVAADDGVMPQTEEAISHAKAAGVPIVVAMNKTDLPGFDPLKTLTGLSTCGIVPSEWGGDVEVVKTSAATGAGIEDLLETLLTIAELQDYRANPDRPAVGVCLDSQQGSDSGVAIKLIVERGTLRVGDVVVCGDGYGKVKAMVDPLSGERIEAAGPSRPVDVFGLDAAPSAGERFYVLDDIGQAREIAEDRADRSRTTMLGSNGFQHVTLETLFERLDGDEEVQTLNLILRADVRGSIEAIEKELSKLQHPEVRLRILQRSVGGISEADVTLADASDAVVIGFNVVPDEKARAKAAQLGVEVRRYEVIYKIADDLRAAMEGMLKPEERELTLGTALVQATFKISRLGVIAGCRVISGVVARDGRMRVIRDSTVVGDYAIDSLKREKDDAKEVRDGYECGIKLVGFNDIKEGDLLECYKIEKISRTFDDR
ncbi:Translation initiation factor IF-2 [Pirellulimonas nuda]|uniref:Translation initiation factor IF-2 n=1 Tax=Pirellulimonas nuda TaxID=2528009 RepID=A0A518D7V7_9BACT|nr:translation initiation factor IF-2 [Pirellulimonas nuda]QDU87535.1 Translation initiation factor IF-2 [Pirellulimonas nuda]